MRIGLNRLALLLALTGCPAPAAAGPLEDCRQDDPDRRLIGCTELIKAGGARDMPVAIAHRYRGFAYQLKGDYDRAIADYNEGIRLDPKAGRTYSNRGWAYIEKREYDRAIADLNEAVKLEPKYSGTFNNRGWAYIEKREYDRAILDLNEALKLDPKNGRAFLNRGRAYNEKQDWDRAILDLNEAIRIEPKLAVAYNHRGWAYNEKQDYERALLDLNEAIRLNPRYAPAYNNRGIAYRSKGDLDRALADYNEAIRLAPKWPLPHNNRGLALARKGEHAKALTDYDESIRLDPKAPRTHSNRGDTYQALGQNDRAIADYRKVLELPAATATDRQRQESARERIARLTEKAAQASSARRVALVIGNSNYKHAGVLTNPRNDARAIADMLRRLGFADVMELHDLDYAGMGRALRDFGDRAAGSAWALVFFAGHGIELNGTNYLIPVDAELKRDTHVPDETLSLDRVQAKVDAASKLGLVILDACRNNPFAARMVRSSGVRSVARGLANIEPEGNVLVAYAAKHGTVAEDGTGKHSPFTEALLAHVEEPGVEVSILFRRIRDTVRQRTQKRQDPFIYGSLGSELLYFKGAPAR